VIRNDARRGGLGDFGDAKDPKTNQLKQGMDHKSLKIVFRILLGSVF
jgi:hypothetical protein